MELFEKFILTFLAYAQELWGPVLLGFFLSGIVFVFIPSRIVQEHLGSGGFKPILLISVIGTILPVCCFGVLPIVVTLKQKGARLGPMLAFLVTTPATSISALAVCWKLLGPLFTAYIFFAVILMGVVIGVIGNLLPYKSKNALASVEKCCADPKPSAAEPRSWNQKVAGVLTHAFIVLPKEIGGELLLGVALASFLVIFDPLQNFIRQYLTGTLGYAAILISGPLTYTCSTASVPMADALLKSGMHWGQAMTYLIEGPITSYSSILVLHKEFGWKILVGYLLSVALLSLAAGLAFEFIFFRQFS